MAQQRRCRVSTPNRQSRTSLCGAESLVSPLTRGKAGGTWGERAASRSVSPPLKSTGAGASLARTSLRNRVFSAFSGLKSASNGAFIAIYQQVNCQTGHEKNREFCARIRAACNYIRVAHADIRDCCAARNTVTPVFDLRGWGCACIVTLTNGTG